MYRKQWPVTIDEAVGVVIATLSDDERASIAGLAQSELIGLHMGVGAWIRNNLSRRLAATCFSSLAARISRRLSPVPVMLV